MIFLKSLTVIQAIGTYVIRRLTLVGNFIFFVISFLKTFLKSPIEKKQLVNQMYIVSIQSLGIILLTGAFAGFALALQGYIGFIRVNAEQFTGLVATLGIIRELGPVLTGIIMSAKNGSAMAAELATMKISEQIDALKTLCINPFEYLVVPRVLALSIMMPFITLFAILFGILASYFLCVYVLSINAQSYITIIQEYVRLKDITGGLLKSIVFGVIISLVGTYYGYTTEGGAKNVGSATTNAVVVGSMLILISNYILSSILFNTGLS